MSTDKITSAIKKAATNENIKISLDPSTYDSTLKSLNIDSLSAMSIIINVEKELNVRLPDEDLSSIKTLGELIKAFERQLNK